MEASVNILRGTVHEPNISTGWLCVPGSRPESSTFIPNWHETFVSDGTLRHTRDSGNRVDRHLPGTVLAGRDRFGDHLEFALKYDGTNPEILAADVSANFPVQAGSGVLGVRERERRFGKYRRRLWYWFELCTGQQLTLAPLDRGPYVDLLGGGGAVHGEGPADPTTTTARQPSRAMTDFARRFGKRLP